MSESNLDGATNAPPPMVRVSCRCILGADHTREQYLAFYAENDDQEDGSRQ